MPSIILKWKKLCEGNKLLELLNIMLMGFSQITLNTNPLCGIILLIAVCVASPVQLLSGIWAVFVAALLIYALGIPIEQAKDGLYTINPALAGLSVSAVTYVNDVQALPGILLFSTVGAVLSLLFTAALSRVLSEYQASPLAAPYSIALMLISSSTYYMTALEPQPLLSPDIAVLQQQAETVWSVKEFAVAVLNGLAQVLWLNDVPGSAWGGIILLIGVLAASRIDALISIYAALLATGTAVLLGLVQSDIMLGLYGYNAVLLSLVLFGRAFRMSRHSFLMISILSIVSVIFCAGMKPFFAAVGAPYAGFPFAMISICVMLGRRYFAKLTYMEPSTWKTPEKSGENPSAE